MGTTGAEANPDKLSRDWAEGGGGVNCLLLELKCVQEVLPIHKAQLLSYMKLLDIPLGLIINFHELKLTDGIVRMILPRANREAEKD